MNGYDYRYLEEYNQRIKVEKNTTTYIRQVESFAIITYDLALEYTFLFKRLADVDFVN